MERIFAIMETLLGPNGCQWDQAQTLETLQKYLIEEAHEVIEAIDEKDPHKIQEELGDLLFVLVFMVKRAEKDHLFTFTKMLENLEQKLIRRHPHIFSKKEDLSPEEVLERWQTIKKTEKKQVNGGFLEGIPPTLPLLRQLQMVVKRMQKTGFTLPQVKKISEEELVRQSLALALSAEISNLSLEDTLRRGLKTLNKAKKNTGD